MEVSLEPIDAPENTNADFDKTNLTNDAPPPPAPSVLLPEPAQDVPVKRPRGRPKGSAKPKETAKAKPAAPLARDTVAPRIPARRAKRPPSSSDSSSDSEPRRPRGTSAAVRNLMQDDIETQVLQFLTAQKASQHQKRNALWKQLASSGLHR